jgi:hypothetical protein
VQFYDYELTAEDALELALVNDPREATLSGSHAYGLWPLDGSGKDLGSGQSPITEEVDFGTAGPYQSDTRVENPPVVLALDGVDGRVVPATTAALTSMEYNTDWSIEAWVKVPVVPTSTGYLFSFMQPASPYRGIGIYLDAAGHWTWFLNTVVGTSDAEIDTDRDDFKDGEWHHYVFSYNGASAQSVPGMKVFVDGVDEPLVTVQDQLSSILQDGSNQVGIGARFNGSPALTAAHFDCEILGLKVHNSALTAVQAAERFYAHGFDSAGAIDGWRFGVSGRNTAKSIVGSTAAQLQYGVTYKALDEEPVLHRSFSGSEYATTGGDVPDLAFDFTDPFTIAVWMNLEQLPSEDVAILYKYAGATLGYSFYVDNPSGAMRVVLRSNTGQVNEVTANQAMTLGEMSLFLVTYDGNTGNWPNSFAFYENNVSQGVADVAFSGTSGGMVGTSPVSIARGTTEHLNADFAKVEVYSGVMSAADREKLLVQGPQGPAVSNLLRSWRFSGREARSTVPSYGTGNDPMTFVGGTPPAVRQAPRRPGTVRTPAQAIKYDPPPEALQANVRAWLTESFPTDGGASDWPEVNGNAPATFNNANLWVDTGVRNGNRAWGYDWTDPGAGTSSVTGAFPTPNYTYALLVVPLLKEPAAPLGGYGNSTRELFVRSRHYLREQRDGFGSVRITSYSGSSGVLADLSGGWGVAVMYGTATERVFRFYREDGSIEETTFLGGGFIDYAANATFGETYIPSASYPTRQLPLQRGDCVFVADPSQAQIDAIVPWQLAKWGIPT